MFVREENEKLSSQEWQNGLPELKTEYYE